MFGRLNPRVSLLFFLLVLEGCFVLYVCGNHHGKLDWFYWNNLLTDYRENTMDTGGNSLPSGPDGVKRKVSYFYHPEIGTYYYGHGHPMKPHRIRMTHALLAQYGLLQHMQIFKPILARDKDLCRFHADDYVAFLRDIRTNTQQDNLSQMKRFNVGEDCPVFEGLYSFCQTYAGGSVGGAVKLNQNQCDIAVNWAGGLHHAKKCEASGFCYVNDIVLAILELLKQHEVCSNMSSICVSFIYISYS